MVNNMVNNAALSLAFHLFYINMDFSVPYGTILTIDWLCRRCYLPCNEHKFNQIKSLCSVKGNVFKILLNVYFQRLNILTHRT